MEVIKIKCPSCKANIEVTKEGMARCPYCGTGIYAERKDEKVIINTTINNYNMATPQTTVHNLGSLYRIIVIVCAVMIILFLLQKYILQVYLTGIMQKFLKKKSLLQGQRSVPRLWLSSWNCCFKSL